MGKQIVGGMGGFTGRVRGFVGYMWNGTWCVRGYSPHIRNPRTEAQQAHRMLFKQEVQLAGRMLPALNLGLRETAREMHMTASNLFVKANQQAFSAVDGELNVDWSRLWVSAGPVSPVAFGEPELDGEGVLTVRFGKAEGYRQGDSMDYVYLYVYCPELGMGYLTEPVYRRRKQISVMLPDSFAGQELQVYGFVVDKEGRASESSYISSVATAAEAEENLLGTINADGGALWNKENNKNSINETENQAVGRRSGIGGDSGDRLQQHLSAAGGGHSAD